MLGLRHSPTEGSWRGAVSYERGTLLHGNQRALAIFPLKGPVGTRFLMSEVTLLHGNQRALGIGLLYRVIREFGTHKTGTVERTDVQIFRLEALRTFLVPAPSVTVSERRGNRLKVWRNLT